MVKYEKIWYSLHIDIMFCLIVNQMFHEVHVAKDTSSIHCLPLTAKNSMHFKSLWAHWAYWLGQLIAFRENRKQNKIFLFFKMTSCNQFKNLENYVILL